jgi:selenocysteine lyase/cysteine desulfurase
MARIDVCRFLSRKDKWYMGGGNRLIWAPPFPLFLDRPGMWDAGHYFNFPMQPLFTWTLLDERGKEIPLEFNSRRWTPDLLTQQFTGRTESVALIAEERKTILPKDVATCTVTLQKWQGRKSRVHFVAWTAKEYSPSKNHSWISDIARIRGSMTFAEHLRLPDAPQHSCGVAFGLDRIPESFSVQVSEATVAQPAWTLSPLAELFSSGRLPRRMGQDGLRAEGCVTLALHAVLDLSPQREVNITVGLAAAPSVVEATASLAEALGSGDPPATSRAHWTGHFAGVPYFECSDKHMTHAYWHRWYGLRLNTIDVSEGNYAYPFVCEGIGYFRAPISYSAFCHMLENRWAHDAGLAQGSLLTFICTQRPDGGFRGYVDVAHTRPEMFYHANWGRALLRVDRIHPWEDFLAEAYTGLTAYARYFDRERDEEVSGLYDIDNHYETGQEYMRRYLAVDPQADRQHWGEVFRLKGVDVTVYIYELKRALAAAARKLGRGAEGELWDLEADRTKEAVRNMFWDPEEEMFFDVNPATGQRTHVKAAVCFYPYFTDIVDAAHLRGLKRHLLNPREFWTPFPAPSSSADDPTFSAEPRWKGTWMNCPWNGRVWPMTNSHIAEALAEAALRFNDRQLKRKAAEFIAKYIAMMFHDGDPKRPNAFEHYNPFTGAPSIYRGIDDYQHSWIVDLIITYVCGIRPDDAGVTIEPLPFGLTHLFIDNVVVRGHRLSLRLRGERRTVWLDGKKIRSVPAGQKIRLHNHAGTSPLSSRVVAAMQEHLRQRSEGMLETYPIDTEMVRRLRESVRALINAEDAKRIAFQPNTSDALNIVAAGIPWKTGDRVLLNDQEFPANVYPYLNLKRSGVELDVVGSRGGIVRVEDIERTLSPRTRLVAVSAVQFLSGQRTDLEAIGDLCRSRGAIFAVDGIQAVGGVRLDVQRMKIDALAAGAQKWQMGPHGSGFLYVTEELQSIIRQQYLGWLGVQDPWDFRNYAQPLAPSARRFEGGSLNMPGLWGMDAALSLLLEQGPSAIEDQILMLTRILAEGLASIPGVTVITPLADKLRAGIVTAQLPSSAGGEAVFSRMQREGVTAAVREGKLRFSPHFYNTPGEMETAVDITRRCLQQP